MLAGGLAGPSQPVEPVLTPALALGNPPLEQVDWVQPPVFFMPGNLGRDWSEQPAMPSLGFVEPIPTPVSTNGIVPQPAPRTTPAIIPSKIPPIGTPLTFVSTETPIGGPFGSPVGSPHEPSPPGLIPTSSGYTPGETSQVVCEPVSMGVFGLAAAVMPWLRRRR